MVGLHCPVATACLQHEGWGALLLSHGMPQPLPSKLLQTGSHNGRAPSLNLWQSITLSLQPIWAPAVALAAAPSHCLFWLLRINGRMYTTNTCTSSNIDQPLSDYAPGCPVTPPTPQAGPLKSS